MTGNPASLVKVWSGLNLDGDIFIGMETPTIRVVGFLSVDEAEALHAFLSDSLRRARERRARGARGGREEGFRDADG